MEPGEIDTAWEELRARWDEEAAHRSFLERFGDLEGLAEAGRRYKEALDLRPDDAVARRWRDEIVKRASTIALAQLPRTRAPRPLSPRTRRALLAAALLLSAAAAGWLLSSMARMVP